MKKSVSSELNRYVQELDRKELENEIKKLYAKFDDVKKFYEMELCQDTTEIVNGYKAQIKKEYFPNKGHGKARSGKSRKVITEFKKFAIFKKDIIELILYRVEMMIEYSRVYGDINQVFYNSLISSFSEACKLIEAEKFDKEFDAECQRLINLTSRIGWGVTLSMEDIYYTYFRK